MKTTKISNLPIIIGKSENFFVSSNQCSDDMHRSERTLINDLIAYYEPHNILEIGVAEGVGSFNILKMICDKDATLTSIDKFEQFIRPQLTDEIFPIGRVAIEAFPDYLGGRWKLITGKDPSEVIEEFDTKYDFCILDTAHVHPIESMNFLSVLPYLSNNAIVILHDTTLYAEPNSMWGANTLKCLATRYLMCAVTADKLVPDVPTWWGFPNIAALQLSNDTRKYIRSVFDMLLVPWEYYPKKDIDNVYSLIKRHYPEQHVLIFEQALEIQVQVNKIKKCLEDGTSHLMNVIPDIDNWNKIKYNTIFYGAGQRMRDLIDYLFKTRLNFNFSIWDINADKIGNVRGHKVTLPNYSPVTTNQELVIMIDNEQIFCELKTQFESLGYKVFHGINNLFKALA